MDDLKKFAVGTIITLVIGGTAYSVTQEDVVNNFAQDTGLTQEQAEQYITGMNEDELDTWDNVGKEMVQEGTDVISIAAGIDCTNYEYEWESVSLSCAQGKSQLQTLGQNTLNLGRSYLKLSTDTATSADMEQTIRDIDTLNASLRLSVVTANFHSTEIEEIRNTNSYNKAVLQAALGGE